MKLSYNWLKEFIDIKTTPDQLALDLNSFGHEVEEVKKVGDDYILDLSITANRGDCLSVLGLAREVAAIYGLKLNKKHPFFKDQSTCQQKQSSYYTSPEINTDNVCPAYTINIIDNIEVKNSSKIICDRLIAYGIRPINNIVDITNYVMIETGQPLHAFDLDKINNIKSEIKEDSPKEFITPEIYIEFAKNGDKLITLDGKERKLNSNNLVIRDSKKIYDLAGIIGGANSEVDKNTKSIILQSAVFVPSVIRKSSKSAKLTTEASHRYERGVSVNNSYLALDYALTLISQSCPMAISVDCVSTGDSSCHGDLFIDLPVDKINNLLGTSIAKKTMLDYLKKLGFDSLKNHIVIPDHRYYDIKIWQDLAEEVARVHGYDKISKSLPDKINPRRSATKCKSAPIRDQYIIKENLKDILVENGFTEVYSYSFADEKLMKMLGDKIDNSRVVINSVAPELKHLRMNLVPSILTAISKNPWAPEIKIFEIGKVFNNDRERWQLGIAECNKNGQEIKQIIDELGINPEIITPDQKVLDYLKIRRPVKYAIIDLDNNILDKIKVPQGSVLNSAKFGDLYKPISQFPPTIRDLAFIVNKDVNSELIRSHISTLSSQILLVELFDEFSFDKISSKSAKNQQDLLLKKNVAYHIWLQNLAKPMDSIRVECITNKIIKSIESKFSAKLRG